MNLTNVAPFGKLNGITNHGRPIIVQVLQFIIKLRARLMCTTYSELPAMVSLHCKRVTSKK